MTEDKIANDPAANPNPLPDQVQGSPRGGLPARMGRYLLGQIPTVAALAALIAIAWWGHHSGWTIPKFSQVTGTAKAVEKEDWCPEHNVPDSECIACHPELAGGNPADWCKEHGVAESRCTVCHPEILTKGVAGDWCIEHGVPESGCTICHEEIAVLGQAPQDETQPQVLPPAGAAAPTTAPAKRPPAAKRPVMEHAQAPATQPGKNPQTCQTHARRVQFASADSVRKAGIKLANVVERPVSANLNAYAQLDYDRTQLAQVSPPVPGKVWRVAREIGQPVRQGELLALVDSAEVGKAKADLLDALAAVELRTKTLKRVKVSAGSGFRTEAELQEAEAALGEANVKLFNAQQSLANLGLPVAKEALADLAAVREKIQFLGLPEAVVKTIDPGKATANLVPLVAPLEGVVISSDVVAGERVDPGKPAFTIANIRRLWLVMDVPPGDARQIRLGQEAVFRPDGQPDRPVSGRVSWISTSVDEQTRTVRVRVNVENPDGRLRARTFGEAQVAVRHEPRAIAVPSEAIQWEGCCYVVFVRLTDRVFQTRKVRIGAVNGGFTEVLVGVLPGEIVATTGSYVLKSEILKANLGAGCTDD